MLLTFQIISVAAIYWVWSALIAKSARWTYLLYRYATNSDFLPGSFDLSQSVTDRHCRMYNHRSPHRILVCRFADAVPYSVTSFLNSGTHSVNLWTKWRHFHVTISGQPLPCYRCYFTEFFLTSLFPRNHNIILHLHTKAVFSLSLEVFF